MALGQRVVLGLRRWGCGLEVVIERGDPVYTLQDLANSRVEWRVDRVSMAVCRPGLLTKERPARKGFVRNGSRSFCVSQGVLNSYSEGAGSWAESAAGLWGWSASLVLRW